MMLCYFGNFMTYYFFVKCTVPPALVDIGYEKAQGTEFLAMISIGGLTDSVAMAFLIVWFR